MSANKQVNKQTETKTMNSKWAMILRRSEVRAWLFDVYCTETEWILEESRVFRTPFFMQNHFTKKKNYYSEREKKKIIYIIQGSVLSKRIYRSQHSGVSTLVMISWFVCMFLFLNIFFSLSLDEGKNHILFKQML